MVPTPISAAGSKPGRGGAAVVTPAGDLRRAGDRTRSAGFTLVELMVVITVIGLAAAAAVWAMPDPRGRLSDEAARFAVRARIARDQAIVSARPVSLWVTAGGYGFDQRIGGQWVPFAEKGLRLERWREGTRALVGDPGGRTRVTFDTTGLADRPYDLRLERRGVAATVSIDADGSARVDE